MDKEKLAIGSTAALLGALLPALISLNIFATKADLYQLEAQIARDYASKKEIVTLVDELREIKKDIKELIRREKE